MLSIIFALETDQEQGMTSDWEVTSEGRGPRERKRAKLGRRKVHSERVQEAASLEVFI